MSRRYVCVRKRPYESKWHAEEKIAKLSNPKLATYLCDFCGKWHLTSHPKSPGVMMDLGAGVKIKLRLPTPG